MYHPNSEIPGPTVRGEVCLQVGGESLFRDGVGVVGVDLRQRERVIERCRARQRGTELRIRLAIQALEEREQLAGIQLRQYHRVRAASALHEVRNADVRDDVESLRSERVGVALHRTARGLV